MAAVEQALAAGDTGTPAVAPAAQLPAPPDLTAGDAYLAENLAALRARWPLDPHQIVVSSRPGVGPAINGFQRLVRRATWWYTLPQWQQIAEFHAAAVRVIDSLLAHQQRLSAQVSPIEPTPIGRTQALEEQIYVLRMEQLALRNRVAELEDRLASPTPGRRRNDSADD
jgi:hypothetical protein